MAAVDYRLCCRNFQEVHCNVEHENLKLAAEYCYKVSWGVDRSSFHEGMCQVAVVDYRLCCS